MSVIIPAFNAELFVREAIESVLTQTHPAIECIVVDDGSTDATAAVAAEFGKRVRLVSQENRGVSRARNRGVEVARGNLVAFLDADDRWRPQRLERGLALMAERPALEAVVCDTEVVDGDLRKLGFLRQDPHVTTADMLLCRARIVSVSSALLVTRACFEELGAFDERLSTSADWALMFRLVERGRLGCVAEPLVQYRLHDASMSASVGRFEHDMLAAFDEIFRDAERRPGLRPMRRRAYANLHRVIAGSYFASGNFRDFASHAGRSVMGHPSTLGYFVGAPLRVLRRAGPWGAGVRAPHRDRVHEA